jgi:phosphohistidine phosphatase
MDLLVVRHAVAEEREQFAKTGHEDIERPLTKAGREKFERGARGLRRIVPSIDLVVTSTLVRAAQTAAILVKTFGGVSMPIDALAPDEDPETLMPFLHKERRRAVVAVVGHEPHLSKLVAYLLSGSRTSFVDLKKGGACLIALGSDPQVGGGELLWLCTASQLRRLA